MNKQKNIFVVGLAVLALVLAMAISSHAAEPMGPTSMGFDMNFPIAVGDTSDVLKNGFGLGFNVAYRKETSPLGIRLDVSYANFGLTSDVLKNVNRADSGWASMWGFDLSALLTPRHAERFRPYLQAGPGFYYQHAEATRFQGGGGVICDPWFGCYDTGSNQTVEDWATWRLGWMGGAGLNIEFDGGGSFYIQTQYHKINNAHADTEYVPIGLGYRQTF